MASPNDPGNRDVTEAWYRWLGTAADPTPEDIAQEIVDGAGRSGDLGQEVESTDNLAADIARAIRAERERCAQIAEEPIAKLRAWPGPHGTRDGLIEYMERLANKIRSRPGGE